jgi:ATP-binding cassette subfamily B protein
MKTIRVVSTGEGGGTDRSGLTGSTDLPDVPAGHEDRGAGARLRNIGSTVQGAVVGFPRVMRLVFSAGPGLTIGLGGSTVLAGIVPAVSAWIVRLLVDTVVATVRGQHVVRLPLTGALHLPATSPTAAIVILIGAQFVLNEGNALASAVSDMCRELLQDKMTLHVQSMVMTQAKRLDLSFFEESGSYDLLRQVEQETPIRSLTMINGAFGLVQTLVTFVSMIGLLITLNPVLALISVIAPVPVFLSQAKYGKQGYLIALLVSPARRRMQYLSDLVATDTYAKEVKLFGLAPFLIRRYRLLADSFYARQRRLVVRRHVAGVAWVTISTLTGTAAYGYVALAAVSGRLTLGDMTLYATATISVQTSLQGLFSGLGGMYENNLYLDILRRLLSAPARISAPPRPRTLPEPLRGHVLFENVCFTYPGAATRVLDNVSLQILPGQTMALVGPNGAGKSTVVKLLCRLYDPDEGRILLDGIDIREFDPAELRRRIGAVFQDHVAYQATAAENIGLGDVEHLEELAPIESAAAKAGAAELVSSLPRGYGTPLGKWFDQGVNLSGGEWQKIALARAFMRDAPILLLDEPSAALDAPAEHDLFSRLRQLAVGKTTLYVSHRFSTVRQADHIVMLDGGRVTEEGTHDELMKLGGQYEYMFGLQAEAYLAAG